MVVEGKAAGLLNGGEGEKSGLWEVLSPSHRRHTVDYGPGHDATRKLVV